MSRTVLLTGIGGPAGRALAGRLLEDGYRVHGTDIRQVHIPGVVCHVVPRAGDPRLVPELLGLVAAHGVSLLIPTVTEELPIVAASRAMIEPICDVVIAGEGAVLTAHDKLLTAQRLSEAGVAVPRFGVPSGFCNADAARAALGGSLVLKPRCSRGGRGVVVVTEDDMIQWSGFGDDHIVQEFAPGIEYAPMVYRGHKEIVAVMEKTGLAQGIVGNATGVRLLGPGQAADVERLALDAVHALGLTGPVDLDIRRRTDGTPVVLEINARFGANSASARAILDAVLAEHDHVRVGVSA